MVIEWTAKIKGVISDLDGCGWVLYRNRSIKFLTKSLKESEDALIARCIACYEKRRRLQNPTDYKDINHKIRTIDSIYLSHILISHPLINRSPDDKRCQFIAGCLLLLLLFFFLLCEIFIAISVFSFFVSSWSCYFVLCDVGLWDKVLLSCLPHESSTGIITIPWILWITIFNWGF